MSTLEESQKLFVLSLKQLRAQCIQYALPAYGTKKILVERIVKFTGHLRENQQPAPEYNLFPKEFFDTFDESAEEIQKRKNFEIDRRNEIWSQNLEYEESSRNDAIKSVISNLKNGTQKEITEKKLLLFLDSLEIKHTSELNFSELLFLVPNLYFSSTNRRETVFPGQAPKVENLGENPKEPKESVKSEEPEEYEDHCFISTDELRRARIAYFQTKSSTVAT